MAGKGKGNLVVPSSEQARENGRKGGKERGRRQKERTTIKQCIELLLEKNASEEELQGLIEHLGVKLPRTTTRYMVLAAAMYRKAAAGDMTAIKSLLDLTGEKEEKPDCEIVIRLEGDLREYGG